MLNNPLPNKDFRNGTFLRTDFIFNYAAIIKTPNAIIKRGENMRKNFNDVIALIIMNTSDKADKPIRTRLINK